MTGGGSLETYAWSPDSSKLGSSGRQGLLIASAPRGREFEVELARARLDLAEQEMDSLKSRIAYLEARAASSVGATERELEELMQVRDALGVGSADVGGLANRLEELMEEPGALLELDDWDDY